MKKSILSSGILILIAIGVVYGIFFSHSEQVTEHTEQTVRLKQPDYFEGVITFEDTYTSSDPAVDVEAIKIQYGTKSEFYIKNGNYKQIYNGSILKSVLFIKNYNRSYIHSSITDTLFYVDCTESNESIVSTEASNNKESVLGRNCSILQIKANDLLDKEFRKSTYYFDESIAINPEWFENSHFGSYDKLYAITKSIPIKTIHEMENYTVTSVAVSIKKQSIDSTFFDLPHGVVTERRR
ncbi:MAG: hypothetical protein IPM69_17745 [Ignavibacteria bacterium]|nr:hypothetical protein [Ignavibacteria bacterium]